MQNISSAEEHEAALQVKARFCVVSAKSEML